MLLHAVSDTNAKILDTVIKKLQDDGYEFKSLNELPTE
ncbi:delta-lactam-biosynthetic de-N-acetylase [Clostridioides difficile]|nr:delta-lactam-biosynthetic de-N-acetylase [Clostridioides difficile]